MDANSRAVRAQAEGQEDRVTVSIEGDLVRSLEGQAYATIVEGLTVVINDPDWRGVFGASAFALPGGTELDVLDEDLAAAQERYDDTGDAWVPVRVNDPDLPPLRCEVLLPYLLQNANPVRRGFGARVGEAATTCTHAAHEMSDLSCMGCFRRWWMARAQAEGINV